MIVSVDSKSLLVIDFVNLNIKPTQSFEVAHMDRMYIYIFIEVNAHTCINICVCTVFLTKINVIFLHVFLNFDTLVVTFCLLVWWLLLCLFSVYK
jgi:hypothetical protein